MTLQDLLISEVIGVLQIEVMGRLDVHAEGEVEVSPHLFV
jgi:hypothetical protein